MNYEVFESIIIKLEKLSERSQKFYDLGLDLINYEDDFQNVISTLLSAYYSEQGYDMISWYMCERIDFNGKINTWIDDDNKEIEMDIKYLYKEVEKIRKSKKFVEYKLKTPMTEEQRLDTIKSLFQ